MDAGVVLRLLHALDVYNCVTPSVAALGLPPIGPLTAVDASDGSQDLLGIVRSYLRIAETLLHIRADFFQQFCSATATSQLADPHQRERSWKLFCTRETFRIHRQLDMDAASRVHRAAEALVCSLKELGTCSAMRSSVLVRQAAALHAFLYPFIRSLDRSYGVGSVHASSMMSDVASLSRASAEAELASSVRSPTIFHFPVLPEEAPGYYQTTEEPVWLCTIADGIRRIILRVWKECLRGLNQEGRSEMDDDDDDMDDIGDSSSGEEEESKGSSLSAQKRIKKYRPGAERLRAIFSGTRRLFALLSETQKKQDHDDDDEEEKNVSGKKPSRECRGGCGDADASLRLAVREWFDAELVTMKGNCVKYNDVDSHYVRQCDAVVSCVRREQRVLSDEAACIDDRDDAVLSRRAEVDAMVVRAVYPAPPPDAVPVRWPPMRLARGPPRPSSRAGEEAASTEGGGALRPASAPGTWQSSSRLRSNNTMRNSETSASPRPDGSAVDGKKTKSVEQNQIKGRGRRRAAAAAAAGCQWVQCDKCNRWLEIAFRWNDRYPNLSCFCQMFNGGSVACRPRSRWALEDDADNVDATGMTVNVPPPPKEVTKTESSSSSSSSSTSSSSSETSEGKHIKATTKVSRREQIEHTKNGKAVKKTSAASAALRSLRRMESKKEKEMKRGNKDGSKGSVGDDDDRGRFGNARNDDIGRAAKRQREGAGIQADDDDDDEEEVRKLLARSNGRGTPASNFRANQLNKGADSSLRSRRTTPVVAPSAAAAADPFKRLWEELAEIEELLRQLKCRQRAGVPGGGGGNHHDRATALSNLDKRLDAVLARLPAAQHS
jgi:hypothetical protein